MIKDNIKNLSLSATLKINERSKVIENDGKNIIKFGFGQSPFPVPNLIIFFPSFSITFDFSFIFSVADKLRFLIVSLIITILTQ